MYPECILIIKKDSVIKKLFEYVYDLVKVIFTQDDPLKRKGVIFLQKINHFAFETLVRICLVLGQY